MSYIVRVGNLVEAPTLQTRDGADYAHARVLVDDSKPDQDGNWHTTATTPYNLHVRGSQARNLVGTARLSGNLRLIFTGRYRAELYTRKDGTQAVGHSVTVDQIGASLRGQTLQKQTPTIELPPAPPPEPEVEANVWLDEPPF